jgi:hypothetical protein
MGFHHSILVTSREGGIAGTPRRQCLIAPLVATGSSAQCASAHKAEDDNKVRG